MSTPMPTAPIPARAETDEPRGTGQGLARRPFFALTAALTILVLCVQAVWAITTPAFRGPDEPHHLNSILRLASGNGWPAPGEAMVDPAVMTAAREAALLTPDSDGFADLADMYRFGAELDVSIDFTQAPVTPQPHRSAIGMVDAADPAATVRDQMTQHPPAYYLLAAGYANLLGLDQWPWDRAVLALRFLSILLTAPLVPALVFVARRLGARRPWALLAGLLPLAIPQVIFSSAMVSNDAAAIGAGSLAIAAMAWAATRRIDAASVVGVGLTVGLALWMKGQLLALGLPLILVFALNRRERWTRRLGGAVAAGALSQIVCPWWLLNLARYGVLQPDGFQRVPFPGWDPADADVGYFLSTALRDFLTSFVAKFGWLEISAPYALSYAVVAVLVVLTVAGVVRLGRRAWVPAALLSAMLGICVVLLHASWQTYVATGQVGGMQGRYLFPFLAAGAIVVVGLARLGRTGFLLGGCAAVAGQVLGLGISLTAFYPGRPGNPVDTERMAQIVGFDASYLAAVLIVFALAMAAIVVGVVVLGDRPGSVSRQRRKNTRAESSSAENSRAENGRAENSRAESRRTETRAENPAVAAVAMRPTLGARTARWTAWLPVVLLVLLAVGPALVGARVFAATDLLESAAPWAENSTVSEIRNICAADTIDSAMPHQLDMRERIAAGELLPDFEGDSSAGTPLGATPDTGTSSPLFWATLPMSNETFTAWIKFLEIVVAVGGMVLWARRIGASTPAGLIGGFLFVTSGFMLMWTNWPQTRTAAFFPLLFWAVERVIQDRTWRSVLPFPLILAALVLGGFPVIVLHTVYLAVLYAIVRLIIVLYRRRAANPGAAAGSAGARVRAWLRAPGLAVAGGVVALGLLAFQLAPWAAQLMASDLSYRENLWRRVYPGEYALMTLFAQGMGTCASDVGFWSGIVPVEAVSFVGSAALILVLAALIMPRHIAPGVRGVLIFGAALGLVLTFIGGPFSEVVRHLPGIGTSGLHRTRATGALCFALLAGIGFDALLHAARGKPVGRFRFVLALLVALVAPVGVALAALEVRSYAPTEEQWARVSASVWLSVAAAATVALLWLAILLSARLRTTTRRVLAVATALIIPVAVLAEGVSAAKAYWPLSSPNTFYRDTFTSAWLRENVGDGRIVGVRGTYGGSGAAVAGLRSLSGHSFAPDDWVDLVEVADPEGWMSPTNMGLSDLALLGSPVMDRLSVRYGVTDTRYPPPGDLVEPYAPDPDDRLTSLVAGGATVPVEGEAAVRAVVVDLHLGPSPAGAHTTGLACEGDAVGVGVDRDPRLTVIITDAEGEVLSEGGRRLRPLEGGRVAVSVDPVPQHRLADQHEVTLHVEGCTSMEVVAADGQDTPWLGLVVDPGDGLEPVPVSETPESVVYENPDALPRVRWASDLATCWNAMECGQKMGMVPATAALVAPEDAERLSTEGLPAELEVIADTDDRQEIIVRAEGDGLLVVADAVHEGWVAEVDGEPVDLITADGALRGVPVPAGEHEVTLRYAPLGRPLLLPLAIATAAGWAALGVFLVLRDRRRAGPSDPNTDQHGDRAGTNDTPRTED